MTTVTVDSYPEQEFYFEQLAANMRKRQYLLAQIQDSKDRLYGSLLGQALRSNALYHPHNERVYCEYAVQEQERLLAGCEYRLWCHDHEVAYQTRPVRYQFVSRI
jgi:hypothetical protein